MYIGSLLPDIWGCCFWIYAKPVQSSVLLPPRTQMEGCSFAASIVPPLVNHKSNWCPMVLMKENDAGKRSRTQRPGISVKFQLDKDFILYL